jgi:hypothetical protein
MLFNQRALIARVLGLIGLCCCTMIFAQQPPLMLGMQLVTPSGCKINTAPYASDVIEVRLGKVAEATQCVNGLMEGFGVTGFRVTRTEGRESTFVRAFRYAQGVPSIEGVAFQRTSENVYFVQIRSMNNSTNIPDARKRPLDELLAHFSSGFEPANVRFFETITKIWYENPDGFINEYLTQWMPPMRNPNFSVDDPKVRGRSARGS